MATAASCHLIPLSSSTFIHEDSWDKESSSSEVPPTCPDDGDDDVVAYLKALGINAAEEFRHLDLAGVQERVALLQRDPNCRPGGIVKSLRNAPPEPTPAMGSSAYLAQLNAQYGDLFRAGSDTSGLVETEDDPLNVLPSLALSARQVAPSDATDTESALLADDLAEGYSAEEALGRLWQRRDGAIDTVEGVRAFGAHNPRDVLTNSVDNRHTTQWRTTE